MNKLWEGKIEIWRSVCVHAYMKGARRCRCVNVKIRARNLLLNSSVFVKERCNGVRLCITNNHAGRQASVRHNWAPITPKSLALALAWHVCPSLRVIKSQHVYTINLPAPAVIAEDLAVWMLDKNVLFLVILVNAIRSRPASITTLTQRQSCSSGSTVTSTHRLTHAADEAFPFR